MLYNPSKQTPYRIQVDSIISYVREIAPKKNTDMFYGSWIEAFISTYPKNHIDKPAPQANYFPINVNIADDCMFRLHLNADKLKKFSSYNNVTELSTEEFLEKDIDYLLDNYTEDIEESNPILIIVNCPDGDVMKPVVVGGYENLSYRIENNFRLYCIEISDIQAAFCLSQPFEQAWYLFISEHNRYKKMHSIKQRFNFMHSSQYRRFL